MRLSNPLTFWAEFRSDKHSILGSLKVHVCVSFFLSGCYCCSVHTRFWWCCAVVMMLMSWCCAVVMMVCSCHDAVLLSWWWCCHDAVLLSWCCCCWHDAVLLSWWWCCRHDAVLLSWCCAFVMMLCFCHDAVLLSWCCAVVMMLCLLLCCKSASVFVLTQFIEGIAEKKPFKLFTDKFSPPPPRAFQGYCATADLTEVGQPALDGPPVKLHPQVVEGRGHHSLLLVPHCLPIIRDQQYRCKWFTKEYPNWIGYSTT